MGPRLVDTHLHLLPGVDDGSPDLASSVEFARALADCGVVAAVCTPHLKREDDPSLDARDVLEVLRAALGEAGIPLELHLGWEVGFTLAAELDVARLRDYTLAGSRYLLLEVPHGGWPVFVEDIVHRVRLAGMVPVLAHPERNARLQGSPELVERLLRLGAHLQGTTSSLLGLFGTDARQFLLELVERGRLSLLATDAHHGRGETWDFTAAVRRLERAVPGADVELLASENPSRLLGDEPLEEARPAPAPGRLRRYLRGVWG